jgi:hypothetical protein
MLKTINHTIKQLKYPSLSATIADKFDNADVHKLLVVNEALNEAMKVSIKKTVRHDGCLLHACSCMKNDRDWYRAIM